MVTPIDDTNANFGWFGTTWSTNHTVDPLTYEYYDGTLWVSQISIGIYGISVDSGDTQYYSGYSEKSTFQQVLYATNGLEEGDHTLKVSNENARNTDEYPNYIWLDVDYAAITGSLTNAASIGSVVIATTIFSTLTAVSSSLTSSSSTPSTSSLIPSSIPIPSSSLTLTSADSSSIAQETLASSSSLRSSSDFPASTVSLTTTNGEQSSAVQSSTGSTAKSYQSVALTQSFHPQSTGTPSTAVISSQTDSSSAESDNNSATHKTTAVAISVTVIVIAFIVIITITGLWFWRRLRRRRYEEDEDERDHLTPAWR
ncbi:hypothetical protein I308_105050 [Cryptococcus tetragattii IND107]|uniref:Uncharacterized protein n=1 Tax=Cryptococcus tetragattii IND107 TaxID=1296105 RepID=A0ABR3BLW9_9TREE